MHDWSEKDVDWLGIHQAACYIGIRIARYGRVNVTQCKEKWGTARVYCSFGWWDLYSVVRPTYVWVPDNMKWMQMTNVTNLKIKDKDGDDIMNAPAASVHVETVSNGWILKIVEEDGEEYTEVYSVHAASEMLDAIKSALGATGRADK